MNVDGNIIECTDREMKLVKECLHNYHELLIKKDNWQDDKEKSNHIIELEYLCQDLSIPGYEFS